MTSSKPIPTLSSPTPTVVLVALLLAAPSAVLATPAEPPEDLVVPAGTVKAVTGPLKVRDLLVDGTLRMDAPGEWVIEARRVHVGPEALIQGLDGADGAVARGEDPTGGPGTPGGDVFLVADELSVAPGGRLQAGRGGHGGDAQGFGLVRGGDGGKGGTVTVRVAWSRVEGGVFPGVGGDGGDAIQQVDGALPLLQEMRSLGGRGGDAGGVRGASTPVDPEDLAREPPAHDIGCAPVGAPGAPGTPDGAAGRGGDACMTLVGTPGLAGADCTGQSSGNAGGGGMPAMALAIGGDGGQGSFTPGIGAGGEGGEASADAVGGDGGMGGDCTRPPSAGGAGGGGGSAKALASGGQGGAGGPNDRGGQGGCARAVAKAGHGGWGGNGTASGGGGGGGGLASASATGGPGGNGGRGGPGGHGGCSSVHSRSGHGGRGGDADPGGRGGVGGTVGSPTRAESKGGQGGSGSPPGKGGRGDGKGEFGQGGDGGSPEGVGGRGGDWSVLSLGGLGGTGLQGLPGGDGGEAVNELVTGESPGGSGEGGTLGPGLRILEEARRGEDGTCQLPCLPTPGVVHVTLKVAPEGAFVVDSFFAGAAVWIMDPSLVTAFNALPGVAGCILSVPDPDLDGNVEGTEVMLHALATGCITSYVTSFGGCFVNEIDGLADGASWWIQYANDFSGGGVCTLFQEGDSLGWVFQTVQFV